MKPKQPKKKQAKKKATSPPKSHKRAFEQLLDDAIFGVKRKDQRG